MDKFGPALPTINNRANIMSLNKQLFDYSLSFIFLHNEKTIST